MSVHAIVLAGGIGSRMNLSTPKQFYCVEGKPIFMFSFEKFVNHLSIDDIVLVIAEEWRDFASRYIVQNPLSKPVRFASPGPSRQHSIKNGLLSLSDIAQDDDLVIIHDAVRPLFPPSIIDFGIEACRDYDGALPVIRVKDTVFRSSTGEMISSVLPREELFLGQTPEIFKYRLYCKAHNRFSDEELMGITGSSELAHLAGMRIKLILGSEQNYKLTTKADLTSFEIVCCALK